MITIYKATIDRARGKLSILKCALFNVGCAHSNICAQDKEILVISSDLGLTQVQQSYTWNIHLTISCFLVTSSFWAVAAKGPLTYVFIAMDHFLLPLLFFLLLPALKPKFLFQNSYSTAGVYKIESSIFFPAMHCVAFKIYDFLHPKAIKQCS